jgi:hypothetical protein
MWSNHNHIHWAATPRQVNSPDEAVEQAVKLVLARVEDAGGEVAQVLKHKDSQHLRQQVSEQELVQMIATFLAWSVVSDVPHSPRVDLFRLAARLRAHLEVA